jgi:hypothetical protein
MAIENAQKLSSRSPPIVKTTFSIFIVAAFRPKAQDLLGKLIFSEAGHIVRHVRE